MTAAKVYRVERAQLERMAAGRARIRNLPKDARLVGMALVGERFGECLGLRYESACFPAVPPGAQLPVVVAVIESVATEATTP